MKTKRPRAGRAAYFHSVALVWTVAIGLVLPSSARAQADVEGASDHPLISRFEGAWIIAHDLADFDEYRIVTAKVMTRREGKSYSDSDALIDENSLHLEGKVTRITYKAPENSSTLQILRSYQKALDDLGAEHLIVCSGDECADSAKRFAQAVFDGTGYSLMGSIEDVRYLGSRVSLSGEAAYVSVLVVGLRQPWVQLDVVEVEGMPEGLVTVDAASMARQLDARGSTQLKGIYFDTGRAELTTNSEPALAEVARLMEDNAELGLFVVGHTDNVGEFEANLALSEARARAVLIALATGHDVDEGRLSARGLGPLAPIAPNTTEDGRAKNRRVMLVVR